MATYIPDPTDPTQPLDTVFANTAAAEFRSLKQYIQTLVPSLGLGGRLLGIQLITVSGIYNPVNPGTNKIYVIGQGAGGAGGGGVATAAGQLGIGGGGGAGGYSEALITSGFVGASVVVGAGGVGVVGAAGNPGGNSSFGGFIQVAGGGGGGAGAAGAAIIAVGGGGGAASLGNVINIQGDSGFPCAASFGSGAVMSGTGASSRYGAGGQARVQGAGVGSAGAPGTNRGSGGGGALSGNGTPATAGGDGTSGLFIVYEYS